MKKITLAIFCAFGGHLFSTVFANEEADMAAMQQKLNAQVMANPFSVEDVEKIEAYVKDAMKQDLKPREKAPVNWRSGYTCANLHGYYDYRDCIYYHRYYGRYW